MIKLPFRMTKIIKSQASLELLFLIVIAFMMVLVFTIVTVNQQKEINSQKEYILLKDLTLKVQSEIFIAANVEDGYSRTFNIPSNLEGYDYNLNISNGTFIVTETKNNLLIMRIPFVNGRINKGDNIIQKDDGEIKIN